MRRTTVGFDGRHAQGYYVPPWTDVPVPQDQLDLRALNPCGGLASTGADMARWSAFVADPVAEVLAPATLEEMCEPQVVMDRERWTAAMGLGFFLVRSGTRTYVGHTGGMPGHITAVFTDREAGTGGVVLTGSGSTPDVAGFATTLADLVTDHEPVDPEPWRPGSVVPPELAELVGVWYSEGSPFVFSVRQGALEARAEGLPEHKPASAVRAGRPRPVPHRRGPRARRAAAGQPRRRRPGHEDELGDVPRHPPSPRLRRVALTLPPTRAGDQADPGRRSGRPGPELTSSRGSGRWPSRPGDNPDGCAAP